MVDPSGPASGSYTSTRTRQIFFRGATFGGTPTRIFNPGNMKVPNPSVPAVDPVIEMRQLFENQGPEIFDYLNEFALFKESLLSRIHRQVFMKSPFWIKTKMPAPKAPESISSNALELINRLGPIAARACEESIVEGVSHSNAETRMFAIRSIWWLIPDSKPTLDAFLREIRKGSSQLFFQNYDSISILNWKWSSSFPQRIVITNALKHCELIQFVAGAFDAIDTPSLAPAVPLFIEVLQHGELLDKSNATRSTNTNLMVGGMMVNNERLDSARGFAAQQLARFSRNDSDIADLLVENLDNETATVRETIGRSLGDNVDDCSDALTHLLKSLEDPDLTSWTSKMYAIGKTGNLAESVLPELIPFTSEEYVKSWFKKVTAANPVPLTATHVRNMNLAAMIAIGRINPSLASTYIPVIVGALGIHSDPVIFLKESTSLSKQIIPLVENYLESPVENKQIIAADILLHHEPEHPKALETLDQHLAESSWQMKRRAAKVLLQHEPAYTVSRKTLLNLMEDDSWINKITAAGFLAQATGENEILMPLLEQGIRSSAPNELLKSIAVIQELDTKPEQFISYLQDALWNPNPQIQRESFRLLLDYGIEYLPGIRK